MNRPRRQYRIAAPITAVVLAVLTAAAQAAIPAAERTALLDLYASTNGSHWNISTNWNGAAGTECTWYGVGCDSSGSTVKAISLIGNNLSGGLPSDLGNLTNIVNFLVSNNALTGAIPSLAGLTSLSLFYVNNNGLTGAIPALDGLTSLTAFSANNNQLTGSIPSLAGLTKLGAFDVGTNALTGAIPSFTGLTGLNYFSANQNQLTGSIPSLADAKNLIYFLVSNNRLSGTIPPPASLTSINTFDVSTNQLTGGIPDFSGLNGLVYIYINNNQLTGTIPALTGIPNLGNFYANNNQLTGAIPALTGLTKLHFYSVSSNQLTGAIPDLAGLTGLTYFAANHNQLTGAIPPLAGLTGLTYFYVRDNQLTGAMPPLTGLANLSVFDAGLNQLTGAIPSLTGLTGLNRFSVDNNQLTGDLPAVPSPNVLVAGGSSLCPNGLNAVTDPAWDAATGQTPWYATCIASPTTANYQGLWWKADESGWGMNFAHSGDQIFATWYTYDTAGKAWWLSMLANRISPAGNSYGGSILATAGPAFNAVPFPPVTAPPTQVGMGTITFADGNNANFAYSVNGVSQSKAITRFDLGTGSQPTCTYSATTPNFAAATNYQDLWWVANGAESGWGVNFAHQGNSIYATWYTYDASNAPLWLSALVTPNGAAYTGVLYRTSGPTFNAYDSSKWIATPVGTASLALADGNHATFGYTTNGQGGLPAANQSKQITRFPFAASGGTVCH